MGQCLCFDFLHVDPELTKAIAGFSNGSIAIWILKNDNIILNEAESTQIYPAMIFVAHLSCVTNVVWNKYNPDHFASTTAMIEESLKVRCSHRSYGHLDKNFVKLCLNRIQAVFNLGFRQIELTLKNLSVRKILTFNAV